MKFLFAVITPLIFAMTLCPEFLSAQEKASDSAQSGEPKLKPVEVDYSTLGGLQYSIDGRLLERYEDFENLVFPLRDFESERLLKRSETSNINSKIFGWVGFAGFATGVVGLLTSPSNQQSPFWVSAIGGGVLIDIGGLFQSEAQTTKFNCVKRYNRFARGEEQVLPQEPADEKSLLNFGSVNQGKGPKKENPKTK